MGNRKTYNVWVERPEEKKNHIEEVGIDRTKILKWLFKKWDREAWTTVIRLGIATGGGLL